MLVEDFNFSYDGDMASKKVDFNSIIEYNRDMTQIFNLILVALTVALHWYWIYKLATYDWANFEEDSEGDNFLKPLE